jgi:hypothetical protein
VPWFAHACKCECNLIFSAILRWKGVPGETQGNIGAKFILKLSFLKHSMEKIIFENMYWEIRIKSSEFIKILVPLWKKLSMPGRIEVTTLWMAFIEVSDAILLLEKFTYKFISRVLYAMHSLQFCMDIRIILARAWLSYCVSLRKNKLISANNRVHLLL